MEPYLLTLNIFLVLLFRLLTLNMTGIVKISFAVVLLKLSINFH